MRAIGRVAIKVEAAADACIKALLELIETKVTYVVQEAVIVIKDVFRRYPGKYEGIIPVLCENLDALDEPESKAAMVWIIGQFANRIENADELMDDLTFGFMDEPVEVCMFSYNSIILYFSFVPIADLRLDVGPTSPTHRLSQTLHLQIPIRDFQEHCPQSPQVGHRRS